MAVLQTDTARVFAGYLREKLVEVGLPLSDSQIVAMTRYYSLLVEWNEKMNLTAVTEPREAAVKHIVDSLMISHYLKGSYLQGPLVDVGTGAGLPGIPLKLAYPDVEMALLDSLQKRLTFLKEVISQLGLQGIGVYHFRAEDAGRSKEHREQYEVVVARAVARLPVLLEYCLPLCRVGGVFVAYKGPDVGEEVSEAQRAAQVLGGSLVQTVKYELPDEMGSRSLVVYEKIQPTPKKYPRRAGTPAKQPL